MTTNGSRKCRFISCLSQEEMLHPSAASELGSLGRLGRKSGTALNADSSVSLLSWREAIYYDAATTMSEAVRTMMRMDAEAQVDAGFLWDFWYPAARSMEIRGQKLVTAMLLEVPLVLGRTSEGKAFAMRDSCPHRGIPLSYGRLDGKVVECCYHGWRFDACSGQCVEVPSLSSQDKLKVERIFAGHYPCEEREQS